MKAARNVTATVLTIASVFLAGRLTNAGWTIDTLALAGMCFALLLLTLTTTWLTGRPKPKGQQPVKIYTGTRVPFTEL